jgi:hypothetical protein
MNKLGDYFLSFSLGMLATTLIISIYPWNEITSDYKVTPQYKLIIKDNKIDTVWIYKRQMNK